MQSWWTKLMDQCSASCWSSKQTNEKVWKHSLSDVSFRPFEKKNWKHLPAILSICVEHQKCTNNHTSYVWRCCTAQPSRCVQSKRNYDEYTAFFRSHFLLLLHLFELGLVSEMKKRIEFSTISMWSGWTNENLWNELNRVWAMSVLCFVILI